MKKFFVVLFMILAVEKAATQNTFFFATKQCRDSVATQLRQQIYHTLQLPLTDSTYEKWMGAYWAMELTQYKSELYEQKISRQIAALPQAGPGFQRSFLEMLYTLYPAVYAKELTAVYKQLKSDKAKAMALEYLSLAGSNAEVEPEDPFRLSPYYEQYLYMRSKEQQPLPLRNQFLDASFLNKQTVLCSFQSANRDNPGYLMIRLPNGTWMKNAKGEELKFTQLARAVSNLPFYLTNGNTPQGLYKITGTDTSENNWIGPTTNLQMILPFESKASDFFGADTLYEAFYKNLLGTKLNSYKGLWESYLAGKLGRTEIIAHGTTIDPSYYKAKPFYPNTPSLGCLCSPELWNENGERVFSKQAEWMKVLQSLTAKPVYLIVAEIKDL